MEIQNTLKTIEELETMQKYGLRQYNHDSTKYSFLTDIKTFLSVPGADTIKNKNGKTIKEFVVNIDRLFNEGLQTFIDEQKKQIGN